MTGSVFNVDDILDIDPDIVTVYEDNSERQVKVWRDEDVPKDVLLRLKKKYITERGIDFVLIHWNAPGNPPSNKIWYKYLLRTEVE